MNANEDTHAIFNQSNGIELTLCESTPKGVQTQRRRGFWRRNTRTARLKRDGGRWGVAHDSKYRPILDAIATLLKAQRPDLAWVLIEQELNSQT